MGITDPWNDIEEQRTRRTVYPVFLSMGQCDTRAYRTEFPVPYSGLQRAHPLRKKDRRRMVGRTFRREDKGCDTKLESGRGVGTDTIVKVKAVFICRSRHDERASRLSSSSLCMRHWDGRVDKLVTVMDPKQRVHRARDLRNESPQLNRLEARTQSNTCSDCIHSFTFSSRRK